MGKNILAAYILVLPSHAYSPVCTHRAAQSGSQSIGERHSDFRNEQTSFSTYGNRQTGLSLLMNGAGHRSGKPESILSTMAAMQQTTHSEDDQDNQARSLAAAGMVAERARQSQPTALQPPPMLASPSFYKITSSNEVDTINWNNTIDTGMHVDDMDLDFATLFDPALEQANMELGELNGWPSSSSDPSMSLSPNRFGGNIGGKMV
jgi:hypothetical protein